VHLVAAAEEDPVGAADQRRQLLVLREGAPVDDGADDAALGPAP
jgi:hypothetical protein